MLFMPYLSVGDFRALALTLLREVLCVCVGWTSRDMVRRAVLCCEFRAQS